MLIFFSHSFMSAFHFSNIKIVSMDPTFMSQTTNKRNGTKNRQCFRNVKMATALSLLADKTFWVQKCPFSIFHELELTCCVIWTRATSNETNTQINFP